MTALPWERPLGARPIDARRTAFRVWAPHAGEIALVLGGGADGADRDGGEEAEGGDRDGGEGVERVALRACGGGVYETVADAPAGTDYAYLIDGRLLPDPASRSQPFGLRGRSRVYAPQTAQRARSRPLHTHVIYELHTGTFSAEGTFAGAIPYLPALAELGVTAIQLMPVAEFPGTRGWGYDGVYLSAAHSPYGGPAGLQRLVAAAHAAGLAVILDVVYNHVGASGTEALTAFGPYFTDRYGTPWGDAINYDGPDSGGVREWACQSAEGWVREFGIDGLRLDAIHAIFDSGAEHIVAEVTRRVHAVDRRAIVIAESGLNDPKVVRPPRCGGWGCDAAWADDFHHALRTLVTDERDGYYAEFGKVADLAKALHRPFVDDGGYSAFRRRRFGAPAGDVPPERFVVFSQNHDQVGNRAFGDRMPAAARPLAALFTLLSPFVPMLFMGEEYGEDAPFQFFCDHIDPAIADATRAGRRREFAAFASFGHEIPDPQSLTTFTSSKLIRSEDEKMRSLYAGALSLRRSIPAGDADTVTFDEDARWLSCVRGPFELIGNFGTRALSRPAGGRAIALATHPQVTLTGDRLDLCPLGGAVLEAAR